MELKEREYRLAGDIAPVSYIVKSGAKGNLLVFDKDKGHNRAIRHCRNEKSIFIDEQSDYAIVEPIIFEKGFLKIAPQDVVTQKYLESHPSNKANGGSVFELVDDEIQAKEDLVYDDLVVDLKLAVREKQKTEKGLYELQTVASVIKGSYVEASKMTLPELRQEIYTAIDANPRAFVDEDGNLTIFDEAVKRKYIALRAIGEGIVKVTVDGKGIIWRETKQLITSVPSGLKPIDYFSEYLETDEGMLVLDKLMSTL